MTCNSKWPEIQEMLKLLPNFDPVDAPDIISCVFKLKLDQLLDLIKKKNYFRKCIGVMHVIEFQKRGLPHVHMRIWLSPESRPNSIKKVDQLVSAEIPDKNSDPIAYEAVKNYMMHGPCGKDLYTSPCMVKGKCMRHFPKRFNGNTYFDDCGFPVYRRRNTGTIINKKGINLENQYVVPYNRDLLLRFQCHINLEICNSSRSLKYLFKYCLKGYDTATMLLKKKSNKSGSEQTARSVKNLDEVKNFLDGRYVCASEASWRIFGFDIHHRSPSVERLPIQLPGQKYLNFQSSANLENVCNNATSKKIKLEAWFVANSEFPQAQNFTYSDFPTQFTWIKKTAKWKLRQRCDVVGRLAELAAMVRFKQTARKTCDADAYVRAQQRAHSSSSSGSDDTIAFSVYAELRREFDMLQGKYDRLIDRLKNVYPDSRNYEGKPKEQMTARFETLVQYVNTKLEEMPAHRDRTSQYVIQMVTDELQSIVKTLREEKTTKPRSDGVEP
ncbi:hypothetical protein AgCh_009322 [Apium graveolens]